MVVLRSSRTGLSNTCAWTCSKLGSKPTRLLFSGINLKPLRPSRNYAIHSQTKRQENISKIVRIYSDHEKEFENTGFAQFCDEGAIAHEFLARKTPQRNGIVEMKNQAMKEIARTLLNSKNITYKLWTKAVSTMFYIAIRVLPQ